MLSSTRKAMLAGAIVAAAALAGPAMASADQWTSNGVPITADTNVDLAGQIQMNAAGGALVVSCDVAGDATLLDSSSTLVAAGTIDTFVIDQPSCTTNLPGCAVTAASTSAPWSIVGSITILKYITISGAAFTNTLSGVGCGPLAGTKTVTANGTLVADFNGSIATLSPASGGLTVTPGGLPATLSGDVELSDDIDLI